MAVGSMCGPADPARFPRREPLMSTQPRPALLVVLTAAVSFVISTHLQADDEAFRDPPQVILDPGSEYQRETRKFQGIPSLERTPEGVLWATWYAGPGPGEDQFNYVVLARSDDDGATWGEPFLIVDPDGDGPVRAFDPELWIDPIGRLWLFWAQAIGHDGTIAGVWTIRTDHPDAATPEWTAPTRLTDGVMMCKPTVLSTGEWVLPVSTWRKTDNSARMVVSTDKGESWQVRGAAHVPPEMRSFDEHHIVERKDGSLWMLVRLSKPAIGESESTDRGETWSTVVPGDLPHVSSRFFIRRLKSGNLLLVKHADGVTARSHLTAYLSRDDGSTWEGGLLLDERPNVSYPDGIQADNGAIYIIHDRNRTKEKDILMSIFTEEDILKADPDSPTVRLRVRVN